MMKSKILVINPANKNKEYNFCEIPLGAAYIFTAIKENSFDVTFFDMQRDGDINEIISLINSLKFSIVAISVNSYHYEVARTIIFTIKKLYPEIIIIVGGVHATFVPEDFYNCNADIVIKGAGDKSIICALNDIESGKFLREYSLCVDIHECNIDYAYFISKGYKPLTICLSRGCNGSCLFCSSHTFWGHKIQRHSSKWLQNVFKIISSSKDRNILFVDDNFFSKYVFDEEINDLLSWAKNTYNFSFVANARIDDFPIRKISNIRDIGFTAISFGLEGLTDDEVYNKKIVSKNYAKMIISKCQEVGIRVRTSWILGLPEYKNNLSQYINMAKNIIYLNPNEISLHWLIPFPGCYYARRKELFNPLQHYSYNMIPYGLYNYLSNDEMNIIANEFYRMLSNAGYSDSQTADKYFYLPSLSKLKRSIK